MKARQYGGAKSSGTQRTASGANANPFSGSLGILADGSKVQKPPGHPDWTSPEDTTNACSTQGGIGTLLAPVDEGHNKGACLPLYHEHKLTSTQAEGRQVGTGLAKNKVVKDQYFKKNYTNGG